MGGCEGPNLGGENGEKVSFEDVADRNPNEKAEEGATGRYIIWKSDTKKNMNRNIQKKEILQNSLTEG